MTAPNPSARTQRSAVKTCAWCGTEYEVGAYGEHIKTLGHKQVVNLHTRIRNRRAKTTWRQKAGVKRFSAAIRQEIIDDYLAASAPPSLDVLSYEEFRKEIQDALDRDGQHDWDETARLADVVAAKIWNGLSVYTTQSAARAYSEASAEPKDGGE